MSRPDGLFIYREIEAGVQESPIYYWACVTDPLIPVSGLLSGLHACGLWRHEQEARDAGSTAFLAVFTVRRVQIADYSKGVLNLRWNCSEEEGKP